MSIKTKQNTKVAIFDIDEVLLDMLSPMHKMYQEFCARPISDDEFIWHMRNFNKEPERYADFGKYFNSSPAYLDLPAKAGMKSVLTQLSRQGYDLSLVSASSSLPELQAKRKANVERCYGKIFSSIVCTGSQDKKSVITDIAKKYDYSIYCDDTPQVVNQSVGVTDKSIWIYNKLYEVYANLLDKDATCIAYKPLDIVQIVCDDNKISRCNLTSYPALLLAEKVLFTENVNDVH